MPLIAPTADDRKFMRLALAEAEKSYKEGGVPVGSVMVRNGAVFADGRNRFRQANDPTCHAEIDAVRNAGMQKDGYQDVTLYSTLSPCMMCTGAMLFVGIPKVVIGDRETYAGDVDFLVQRGMSVVLLDDHASRCSGASSPRIRISGTGSCSERSSGPQAFVERSTPSCSGLTRRIHGSAKPDPDLFGYCLGAMDPRVKPEGDG